jgi:hypothetical protein
MLLEDDAEGMESGRRGPISVVGAHVNRPKHNVRRLSVLELRAKRIEEEQRHATDARSVSEIEERITGDEKSFGPASHLQRANGLPLDAIARRKSNDAI